MKSTHLEPQSGSDSDAVLIKSFTSLLGLWARMSRVTWWWEDVVMKEMSAPESIRTVLNRWEAGRDLESHSDAGIWVLKLILSSLLSSSLPVRDNSSS